LVTKLLGKLSALQIFKKSVAIGIARTFALIMASAYVKCACAIQGEH